METISLMLLFGLITTSEATHCDKDLKYHDNYGYGTDITCDGLSDENEDFLTQISVSHELLLKINNSNFTKVESNLFNNVSKIKYLSIANSTFSYKNDEEIFSELAQLEHLTVENTVFSLNLRVFKGLESLKELNLLNTSLKGIKNETVGTLKKLEILKLTNNNFTSLLEVPFCDLPALKHLYLDRNKIRDITDNFSLCFQSQVENINLNGESVPISFGQLSVYHQTKSTFNLVELNLSHNQIREIQSLDWVLELRHIDLSNNQIRTIDEKLFMNLRQLEKLQLQGNLLENVDPEAFSNLVSLKFVNFENNSLSEVRLQNLSNLEEVNLSKNKIASRGLKHLGSLPKLRFLSLSNNLIEDLPSTIFQNFPVLEVLDLSKNHIVLSEVSFKDLTPLKRLILENNDLAYIPAFTFDKMTKLEILDISGNSLSSFSDFNTFVGLGNLEVLNMSRNSLENLNCELFKPLHSLQVLDLSENKLRSFNMTVLSSSLPLLRVIDIKTNLLSCGTLANIIQYLKSKRIEYTLNDELQYDGQNIGGIFCKETPSRMIAESEGMSAFSIMGILFIVVASALVISFSFYKCLLYSKRRRYFMDELELL